MASSLGHLSDKSTPEKISGAFAIIAPIITLLLKQYFDNRAKQTISAGRRQAIAGNWEGIARQEQGPHDQPIDFSVAFELTAGRKTVSGKLTIRFELNGQKELSHFNVTGGFHYGSFLQLNYTPSDETTIQFGSIILQLNASGKVLQGRFAGFGKITQSVISGTAELKKVP